MKPNITVGPADGAHSPSLVIAWRDAVRDALLPPTTKLIAMILSTHMNGDGGSCYPGTKSLMAETGLKRTAVYEHLAELEREGWLRSEKRSGRGGPRAYEGTFPDDLSAVADSSTRRTVPPERTVSELSTNRPPRETPLSIEGGRARGRKKVRALRGVPDSGTAARAKPTWLTVYLDEHKAVTGGVPNAGVMARCLKPLHDEHGEATVLARQAVYLTYLAGRDELQFLSYPKFAETFGQWVRAPAPRGGGRPTMNVDDKDFLA